jgi:hypothetical protein
MVRLASVALLVAVIETSAWSQSIGPASKPLSTEASRMPENGRPTSSFSLPHSLENSIGIGPNSRIFAGTEVSPNSVLGLGVFGPKRDRAALTPVTVYEINTRQSRKPGLGFSLKF